MQNNYSGEYFEIYKCNFQQTLFHSCTFLVLIFKMKYSIYLCCINWFTSLCKNLFNLLEFLAEAFRCHLHHFQCSKGGDGYNLPEGWTDSDREAGCSEPVTTGRAYITCVSGPDGLWRTRGGAQHYRVPRKQVVMPRVQSRGRLTHTFLHSEYPNTHQSF